MGNELAKSVNTYLANQIYSYQAKINTLEEPNFFNLIFLQQKASILQTFKSNQNLNPKPVKLIFGEN